MHRVNTVFTDRNAPLKFCSVITRAEVGTTKSSKEKEVSYGKCLINSELEDSGVESEISSIAL